MRDARGPPCPNALPTLLPQAQARISSSWRIGRWSTVPAKISIPLLESDVPGRSASGQADGLITETAFQAELRVGRRAFPFSQTISHRPTFSDRKLGALEGEDSTADHLLEAQVHVLARLKRS